MKKHKRNKRTIPISITREDLESMHAAVKALRPEKGTDGYSFLCALGSCLGNWPRVKRKMAAELRERFARLETDLCPR